MLCENPESPICREFVNQGKCRAGTKCRFYHPPNITTVEKKRANKKPGFCYCGAPLKCMVSRKFYNTTVITPTFFYVCGNTRKAIKKCLQKIVSASNQEMSQEIVSAS